MQCSGSRGDLFTLSFCFNLAKTTESAAWTDTDRAEGWRSGKMKGHGRPGETNCFRPLDALSRPPLFDPCADLGLQNGDGRGF